MRGAPRGAMPMRTAEVGLRPPRSVHAESEASPSPAALSSVSLSYVSLSSVSLSSVSLSYVTRPHSLLLLVRPSATHWPTVTRFPPISRLEKRGQGVAVLSAVSEVDRNTVGT
ncbi:unnamed protein product [Gadus morhua 'NCC']